MSAELLSRGKTFSHRVADVTEVLEAKRRSRRIVDQLFGSGTSVGANLYEADDAVSRKDFCKSLGTVLKELGETRFWLEFVGERGWIQQKRLVPLIGECQEMKRLFGTMLARIKRNDAAAR
ncbi:MAG: four helix bundle protein [Phycisphaerales bacterium]|nr:four helix bundle protein [Phycisphaerales bacterium]